MVFQTNDNQYQTSKFIVTAAGDGPYTTIQAALDAADTEAIATSSPQTVVIRSGVYTEDLTLYASVSLRGVDGGSVIVAGVHTPPVLGSVVFTNLTVRSPTDILNTANAGAGAGGIIFESCIFETTNGYVFNMPNWTSPLNIIQCADISTVNGLVNNAGGATVNIWASIVGAGATALAVTGGSLTIFNSRIVNPITTAGACTFAATMGSLFANTLTIGGTSTATITNSYFETDTNQAITQSSAGQIVLTDVSIDSTNASVIGGAGAGAVLFGSVTYIQGNTIAGTVTQNYGSKLQTGALTSSGVLQLVPTATQDIVAGTGITAAMFAGIVRVQGSGGAVTVTATPSIADGIDGQIIIIQGDSDANTLELQDESSLANTGLQLSGGNNFTLGQYDILQLTFDAGLDKWLEISRSDN